MTPSEFKAWFEGFTESMDGPPSHKQWEKVQARVKEITGQPVTYPIFVDRYLPSVGVWRAPYYPYGISACATNAFNYSAWPVTAAQGGGSGNWQTVKIGGTGLGPDGHMARFSQGDGGTVFDSHSAMNALGKADAESLAA